MNRKQHVRKMSGGHALAHSLRSEGVRHAFSVPGESYIALLDGLRDIPDITVITNRHEGSACLMAEAYGKTTRMPGVCMVTRGPGATNASIGVHLARYDSTPLILLIGQVARAHRGREAGQEIDYTHFFGSIAKWVVEIDDPRDVPRILARAFYVARSGRPGPVVISLPRDMLEEEADIAMVEPYPTARPSPDPELIRNMVDRVNRAEKPVLLAGSGTQYAHARDELVAFAEKFQLPVLTAFKRQDVFPNTHPHYVGNLGSRDNHAKQIVRDEADLLLIGGCRFNQQVSGNYTLPHPGLPTIQIDTDAANIGQNFRPELGVNADPKQALALALEHASSGPDEGRIAWIADYHARQQRYATPPERPTGAVSMERVMTDLKAIVPPNTIHTGDAGSFGGWVQRYIEFDYADSYIVPTLGSMGPGVPAAVAAGLAHPDRTVIAHVGDGGFLMTGQEIATARQYGVKIIVMVYANGSFGTIRMDQEARYPGRSYGTDLVNPDFAALGNGYGALGIKVSRDEDFLPALEQALADPGPVLIEVLTDLEYVSPTTTLKEVASRNTSP